MLKEEGNMVCKKCRQSSIALSVHTSLQHVPVDVVGLYITLTTALCTHAAAIHANTTQCESLHAMGEADSALN